ncbi:hypothetical protein PIB30_088238, partial [Stylosanthes scabra]|nr:hypothetical protein [Stylosanthes scabra]
RLPLVIPTHQTVLKSEHPRSANRRPKLLPSSLSFMFKQPLFQFSGNFSDDYFRHCIHQNVPLFVTILPQQTDHQSDTRRALKRRRKPLCSSSFSLILQQFQTPLDLCPSTPQVDPRHPSVWPLNALQQPSDRLFLDAPDSATSPIPVSSPGASVAVRSFPLFNAPDRATSHHNR